MESMGQKFTRAVVRCLLGSLSMFGPMCGPMRGWHFFESYMAIIVHTVLTESLNHLHLPALPHNSLHLLIRATYVF